MTWTWRVSGPGDIYAIVPYKGEELLPYAVCRVGESFEAWHRDINPRGGYWGGEMLSRHDDPHQARAACLAHAQTPAPAGEGSATASGEEAAR